MLNIFDSIKQLAKQAGQVLTYGMIIRAHPAITDKPLCEDAGLA